MTILHIIKTFTLEQYHTVNQVSPLIFTLHTYTPGHVVRTRGQLRLNQMVPQVIYIYQFDHNK